MKKVAVILAAVVSLAVAGMAEAAKPKKRTRNANRVGAYGAALFGNTTFNGDQEVNEQQLIDTLENQGFPTQNIVGSTEDSDLGYQVAFGYRFTRYFAAELGLAQYGELASRASGEIDIGDGFVPASLKLAFSAGGPLISAIGILPLGEKFEIYGRAGMLFASAERELSSRLDGQSGGFGSAKGDSQELVVGIGASYHFNVMYSVRAEYQKIDSVGQESRTGTEELDFASIGVVVRF